MPKIAVLTSGGDSPGMNSAVTSVARTAAYYGLELIGIKRGYNGLLGLQDGPEDDIFTMNLDTVLDLADLPGTYLRTARCEQFLDRSGKSTSGSGKLPAREPRSACFFAGLRSSY